MIRIKSVFWLILLGVLLRVTVDGAGRPDGYDPLHITDQAQLDTLELRVFDTGRERSIPVLVTLPADTTPAPVILFSHGLGGSRYGNRYLRQHWACRGYAVVFVQHPGSDAAVWRDSPPRKRMDALKDAANLQTLLQRLRDVPAVLDQLEQWHTETGHVLSGRLDLDRVGMSGHSFGAMTTQMVSGQQVPRGRRSFTDPRIKAAIAFSPSSPRRGSPDQAFGSVDIPWMLMTGTLDTAPIGDAGVESRLAVYPALPPGGKYEVLLHNAEHSAFTDRSLPGDAVERNPNHHRVILALSTAFWDTWLCGNGQAKSWLHGEGAPSVLETKDRWQLK
jgi:predicted dienelactone hydrolase